ncbi:hypothetical protein IKE71_03695 [Candidatus Saccharibacteria bacterium]|nr:hypothetical protein [Candidatus Saccharibacteria bacterium]
MKYEEGSIPVCVMQRAIEGINAADQCDQAGWWEYELRRALKRVLEWYHAPIYQEELEVCRCIGLLPKEGENK